MKYSMSISSAAVDRLSLVMHLENQNGSVDRYDFLSNIKAISDTPNVTKMFGKCQENYTTDKYQFYPLQEGGIETGNYRIIEDKQNYKILEFTSGVILTGIWIVRLCNDGRYLLWKPTPDGYVCPAQTYSTEVVGEGQEVLQQYASFNVATRDQSFEGIGVSSGVVVGLDNHPTLVTPQNIRDMYKQMKTDQKRLIVDYDHSTVTPRTIQSIDQIKSEGSIDSLELVDNDKITYVYVKGTGNKGIQLGTALSINWRSNLVWDDTLNVYVLKTVKVVGFSLVKEMKPACKICYVK